MADEADFGIDISCVDDLDPGLGVVSGRRVLAESLARRVSMNPGSAIDCPNDGIDLADYLSDEADDQNVSRIESLARAEMLKDDRVTEIEATAVLEGDPGARTLSLQCVVTDADGPFPLTLLVSAVNTSIIEGP